MPLPALLLVAGGVAAFQEPQLIDRSSLPRYELVVDVRLGDPGLVRERSNRVGGYIMTAAGLVVIGTALLKQPAGSSGMAASLLAAALSSYFLPGVASASGPVTVTISPF